MNSLNMLRRRAKALKRDFRANGDEARSRVHKVLPDAETLQHNQALHVIAREEGYDSWPRLKFAVELAAMDRLKRAERLKFALYLGQGWIVDDLLAADPDLAMENFGLACALYRADHVERVLARTPEAATRMVGVRSPILHLAFSRFHRQSPSAAEHAIAVAEALVTHGADVNDSYPSEPGSEHPLSALYGALGHAGNLPLASWLLEHGADPDDNESLYHATELPHLDGVRLLLRHGVRTGGTNALARMLDFDNLEGVDLLLTYGADPNEAVLDHPSGQPIDTIPALHQAARRGRDGRFAALLIKHGADATFTWKGHTAYALARIHGNTSFATALADAGHGHDLSPTEEALARCADGTVPEGRPLATLPLDDEERRVLSRIIMDEDRLDHCRRLVAAGMDPDVTEEMGMPPLHIAAWAGLAEQTAWLLTLDPDLSHINAYGGDLIGTIVHGSENRLDVETRDHVGCARLALDAGAMLRRSDLEGAMNEEMVAFLTDWAEAHPERVVDDRT